MKRTREARVLSIRAPSSDSKCADDGGKAADEGVAQDSLFKSCGFPIRGACARSHLEASPAAEPHFIVLTFRPPHFLWD